MKKILVLGATSAIAQATARLYATAGDRLFLVARDEQKLRAVAEDLTVRGARRMECLVADLTDVQSHQRLIDQVWERLGDVDIVLMAYGTLPDQAACEKDFATARLAIASNFMSVVSLLTPIANRLQEQGRGTIAVISSVAGDRGRGSNYVYGTAKAALSTFLQGLRNRLHRSGVHVLTIKPGFVDTPMTAHLNKNLLFAKPEKIAAGIVKAVSKKKDIVYLPCYWRCIMTIVRLIPERVFKRLSL